ncbi:MAG: HEXXH motif-containing putative peptide modification protein [Pseudomonadota bacterium]|nr:HEXXH motif-containing putative peptide modification protein [Pseudomonadota bacterium]
MRPAAPYTLPEHGVVWLTRARSRYLARAARLLLDPTSVPSWLMSAWSGVREPFADILRAHPGDLLAAIALPQVGAPLCAGRLDEAIPQLLLELSRRRVLGREGMWWPNVVPRLLSAPRGVARTFDPPLIGALFSDGEVEIAAGVPWDEGGERAFLPLARGGWLALADNNPLALVEAHPDKSGNALSLGGHTAEAWVEALDAARALIARALPDVAAEHAQVLALVVPVGFEAEKSLSASYREAIGVVYLTLHPKVAVLAEALLHEVQHNKLNLLLWSDALLHDDGVLVSSPVRPDPRPLLGVLLAVHAFLPVAQLHLELLAQGHPAGDPERLRQVMQANREGLAVLAGARPTALGAVLLDGMRALEQWQREAVGQATGGATGAR